MQIQKFKIRNFKGIQEATVNLGRNDGVRVHALVGLNESGKTTILEALNLFVSSDEEISSVYNTVATAPKYNDYVPKKSKGNFSDSIKISAYIQLSDDDVSVIASAFESSGEYEFLSVQLGQSAPLLEVTRVLKYVGSEFSKATTEWDLKVLCRNKKGKKKEYVFSAESAAWHTCVKALRAKIPQISYFPTFLFDLPERIYLEACADETEREVYYRRLIQDVLHSLGKGYDLDQHLVARIRPSDAPFDWFGYLASDRKKQVNAVLLEASDRISEVVFSSWQRVFGKNFKDKRVRLEPGYDSDSDRVYVNLTLLDGPSEYAISERSLGFRWFFCFLLFTYFRGLRQDTKGVVFLFDEPASNLHAKAQEELLSSFEMIAGATNVILYSTHSQYLINPNWLGAAYIVVNGALNYDDLSAEAPRLESDIRAIAYRDFVGQGADGITYLIPVLDALDHKPSPFEHRGPAVLVEGRFDYSFLMLCRSDKEAIYVLPGRSATSLDPIISLLIGWGEPFTVLLDGDEDGRDAVLKYQLVWGLTPARCATLDSVSQAFKGKDLEKLVKDALGTEIKAHFGTSKVSTKQVQLYIYEAWAKNDRSMLNAQSIALGETVWKWVKASFQNA